MYKGSNYFRKFLDSPDKQNESVSDPALLRYDYSTVFDEDDTWGLVTVAKAPLLTEEMISRTNDIEGEIEGFRQLLCAMYSTPYTIKDFEELSTLTRIADFYCALPIVSATLTGALIDSPIFLKREVEDPSACTKDQLAEDYDSMIFLAQKLRNPILFHPLLANNLVLDRTNDGPGEGCYKHCFLCTEIADNELPWETMAVDW
ncbi:hypothetical protein BPOR_0206g00130 [Botrytis porri]|uniref:BTB domain-containing protein n=1 Tax=Botrytis porri TaxID=87229 RepID=A0A4Z1KTL8_9HELO|nr:hypothetical protein BPOR_0206g00130 [Botrytis porri]